MNRKVKEAFSLHSDTADYEEIKERIISGGQVNLQRRKRMTRRLGQWMDEVYDDTCNIIFVSGGNVYEVFEK